MRQPYFIARYSLQVFMDRERQRVTSMASVPMGQKLHQVRAWKKKLRITPASVVTPMMIRNTNPMAEISPQAAYI